MRRYWTCTRCHNRNPRTNLKCLSEGCAGRRPKARVPKHARTLRDQTWAEYDRINAAIHGLEDGSCAVCGRPEHEAMHHHREHDHVTGLPRGLVCFQCNQLMPRLLTLERARLIVGYLERVEAYYAREESGMKSASEATATWNDKAGLVMRVLDGTATEEERERFAEMFPALRDASLSQLNAMIHHP